MPRKRFSPNREPCQHQTTMIYVYNIFDKLATEKVPVPCYPLFRYSIYYPVYALCGKKSRFENEGVVPSIARLFVFFEVHSVPYLVQ